MDRPLLRAGLSAARVLHIGLLACFVSVALAAPTANADVAAADAPPATDAPRTLTRQVDPVVVTGNRLGALLGTPLDRLGCFRLEAVRLEPIPCQVDERTDKGAYVLPKGPEANPGDGDGRLSPRDELVFMARDSGGRSSSPPWPAGVTGGVELEVVDPIDGGRGYVYLAAFDRAAPRSPMDYVRYVPGAEKVESSSYLLGYSRKAPIVFDTLAIKRAAGGSGQDPVDRMKIRLTAKVWSTIPIVKTEDDYTSAMIGYIDGPVRVLRRTRNRLVLFWKIPSPSAIQDNFFYESSFEFPISVSLPLDLDTFLSEATLRISVDLEGSPAKRFVNERNGTPVSVDGLETDDERRLDPRPYRYSLVYGTRDGDQAGWFNRLTVSAGTAIDPELYYGDDQRHPDPPEEVPGEVGDLGYLVRNLRGLKKGTHYLTSVMYTFPRYTEGLEKRYLAIQDAPLRVRLIRSFP